MLPSQYTSLVQNVAHDDQFLVMLETNDALNTIYHEEEDPKTKGPYVLSKKWRIMQYFFELRGIVPFSPILYGAYVMQLVSFDPTSSSLVFANIVKDWLWPERTLEKFKAQLDDNFVDKAMGKPKKTAKSNKRK